MNASRFISAVAIIGGLLSASASAHSATYWDYLNTIRASTPTAVAKADVDPKVFESPLAHLRETHGVGLPSINQTAAMHGEGAACQIATIASVGSSLIDLSLAHGVEAARTSRC